ncbi:MAG: TolC family protein, partial [Flavobacterium sp.]
MKKNILTTFLLVSVLTAKVNAQEIKELSLKDAISFALENKSEAKKAKLEVENSEYKIQEARSRALPQISANG